MVDQAPTMPETDWLTGLSSRAAFARQVNQTDRDGDRFAVAVIGLVDFGAVNRQVGYDAGDDLLRQIGRALADHTSMTTIVSRLGGARFGLLDLGSGSAVGGGHNLERWLEPIVDQLKTTISDWAFEQHDFAGGPVLTPDLLVGTAEGYGSRVWVEATVALEIAEGQPTGRPIVAYDLADRRVADRRQRDRTVDAVVEAMSGDRLVTIGRPTIGTATGWTGPAWWRLDVAEPDRRRTTAPVRRAGLPADIEAKLDLWLLEQAISILTAATGPIRLTVPLSGLPANPAGGDASNQLVAVMRRGGVPPSRILFEIDEPAAIELSARHPELAGQLGALGTTVVLAGCEGGWRTLRAGAELPIAYLKPSADLMTAALDGDRAAQRVLEAIAVSAADHDRELIAPATAGHDLSATVGLATDITYLETDRYHHAEDLTASLSAGDDGDRRAHES